jgi:hypothetical protein
MTFKKMAFLLIITLFSMPAFADIVVSFPFENITLHPNETLQSNYAFGNFSLMFCFENTLQDVGVITWPLRGKRLSSHLPVFLKTKEIFDGNFADANGVITIHNNQNINLIVSCLLAY